MGVLGPQTGHGTTTVISGQNVPRPFQVSHVSLNIEEEESHFS
jgi:hypothetical protein